MDSNERRLCDMPSEVKSNVIGVEFYPEAPLRLDQYLETSSILPIELFDRNGSMVDAIALAVSYLTARGEGKVVIPANETHATVVVEVKLNRLRQPVVNFTAEGYKKPTSNRPYTDEHWQVGDTIINTDVKSNKCIGWICVEAGSPGTWERFGNIKPWTTMLEELDYLPDASELQVGRQVLYKDATGYSSLYFCANVNGTFKWIQQNMAMGSEEDRPENPSDNWWYFNTTIGYPQWYDSRISEWRTIYDKATYETMWVDYQAALDKHVNDLIQHGYDTVLSDTRTQLIELYDSRYNEWYNLVTTQYLKAIKEPVDTYLAMHPDLIGQRYSVINSTVTRGLLENNTGDVIYRAYEIENGSIDAMSIMPTMFLLNFEADMNSSEKETYFQLFGTRFKIVDTNLNPLVFISKGAICTLLIDQTKEYCVLSSASKDLPSYKTAHRSEAVNNYLYLSDSVESYAQIDIKGTVSGTSDVKIYSLENLIDLTKLKSPGTTSNSFQVAYTEVVFNSGSITGSDNEAARVTAKVKPNTDYRFFMEETANKRSLKVDISLGGNTIVVTAGNATLNRNVIKQFNSGDNQEVTIIFTFDRSAPANSVSKVSSMYLVEVPDLKHNYPDFYLPDYIFSKLHKEGDIYDEFLDNIFTQRIIKGYLISPTERVDYLNSSSYLADGYAQLSIDLSHSNLSKSIYLPDNDDTVSEIASYYSDDVNFVSYNKALAGTKSTFRVGLSKKGVLACNVPMSLLNNKSPLGAFKYVLSTSLAAKKISFILKDIDKHELALYPTPLRVHSRGVMYINDTNADVSFKYPVNNVSATEVNTKVLELMLNQRITLKPSPLSWESDLTWDEAAQNNKDWRGEQCL